MPTLLELEARFIKVDSNKIYSTVDYLGSADGIIFLCPKCFKANNGSVGTHSVLCWFSGKVPDDLDPKPGRWTPQGTGLNDLTFIPGSGKSNSMLLLGGCNWHGFIVNGQAD